MIPPGWRIRTKIIGVVTLQQMLEEAERRGYGEQERLRSTFLNWQRRGLIGNAISKADRRGGEGYWHPHQSALWIHLLHHREAGIRLSTMANRPVGLWFLSDPGIELRQAQRAVGFWAARKPPKGRRSLQRQAVKAQVAYLAAPNASTASRLKLQDLIEDLHAVAPAFPYSPDTVARDVANVLAPDAASLSQRQKREVAGFERTYRLQVLAHKHIGLLLPDREDVTEFWHWSRNVFAKNLTAYRQIQPTLAGDPETGHLYTAPELQAIVNTACATAMLIFGTGLQQRDPQESDGPPDLIANAPKQPATFPRTSGSRQALSHAMPSPSPSST